MIKQHRKRIFHRNQGNQAFIGWGDLDTALGLTYLLQEACLHRATYLLYRSDTEMPALNKRPPHPTFLPLPLKLKLATTPKIE